MVATDYRPPEFADLISQSRLAVFLKEWPFRQADILLFDVSPNIIEDRSLAITNPPAKRFQIGIIGRHGYSDGLKQFDGNCGAWLRTFRLPYHLPQPMVY